MCFTKQDKLSKKKRLENLNDYKKEMIKDWEELPSIFISSSTEGTGKESILTFIEESNRLFQ